jgi:hypothetical protein
MDRYAYAFRLAQRRDEIFVQFPKYPEIITALPSRQFKALDRKGLREYALDALLTALQLRIGSRADIPRSDTAAAHRGILPIVLPVVQAMKLELYQVYRQSHWQSVAEFARALDKSETVVRRLLNLRHQSWPSEIEAVLELLGKRLRHAWIVEDAPDSLAPDRRPRTNGKRASATRHAML